MNVVFRYLSGNLLYCIVFVSTVFAGFAGMSLVFKKIVRVISLKYNRKRLANGRKK